MDLVIGLFALNLSSENQPTPRKRQAAWRSSDASVDWRSHSEGQPRAGRCERQMRSTWSSQYGLIWLPLKASTPTPTRPSKLRCIVGRLLQVEKHREGQLSQLNERRHGLEQLRGRDRYGSEEKNGWAKPWCLLFASVGHPLSFFVFAFASVHYIFDIWCLRKTIKTS